MKFQKIGFIKSLYYYLINPYWEIFFSELGYKPIYAGISRQQLPSKTNIFENELCLPVKYFLAQAGQLINGDVDFIFCPLTSSLGEGIYCCPKVIMTTELIRTYFPHLDHSRMIAPILFELYYGLRSRFRSFRQIAYRIGDQLNLDYSDVKYACLEAESAQSIYEEEMKNLKLFHNDNQQQNGKIDRVSFANKSQILLLGHRYTIHNPILNNYIVDELRRLNVTPISKEHLNMAQKLTPKELIGIETDFYFSEGAEIFQAAQMGISSQSIRGIVYVSMFNCGFDAAIEDIILRKFIKPNSKPYLFLVLDEHSTKSNLATKLEVFIDLVGGHKNG